MMVEATNAAEKVMQAAKAVRLEHYTDATMHDYTKAFELYRDAHNQEAGYRRAILEGRAGGFAERQDARLIDDD